MPEQQRKGNKRALSAGPPELPRSEPRTQIYRAEMQSLSKPGRDNSVSDFKCGLGQLITRTTMAQTAAAEDHDRGRQTQPSYQATGRKRMLYPASAFVERLADAAAFMRAASSAAWNSLNNFAAGRILFKERQERIFGTRLRTRVLSELLEKSFAGSPQFQRANIADKQIEGFVGELIPVRRLTCNH
jgi:hypothetical protein